MADEVIDRADEVVDAAAPGPTPAVLEPLQRIEAGLSALAEEAKQVAALDLSTTAGDKAERQLRLRCVTLRVELDRAYETVNRPLLDTQREARRLVAEIKEAIGRIEDPADARIKAREAEKEAERERRAETERQRVAAIRVRIEAIAGVARRAVGKPSADIEAKIRLVVGIEVDESFAELAGEAARVHAETLASLRELLASQQELEAEAARQQAERDRLARAGEFQARLHNLRSITVGMASRSAEAIRIAVANVEAAEVGDDWAEFREQAVAARAEVLAQLRQMLADAEDRERTAAAQAAEADRLERQRQEQAAEDALVASIAASAARVEGDAIGYIQKAIAGFESAAPDWENDPRPRVAQAVADGRKSLADRLVAARLQEREVDLQRRERIAELDRVGAALLRAVERVGNARADAELARFSLDPRGVLSCDVDDCIAALDALEPDDRIERFVRAFTAASERVGSARVFDARDAFFDTVGVAVGASLPPQHDEAYLAMLNALKPQTEEAPADATRIEPAAATADAQAGGAAEPAAEASAGPADNGVRVKLGDLCQALGFTIDRAFVVTVCGVKPVPVKGRAVLIRSCDVPLVCDAIAARAVALRSREWQ